MQVITPLFKLEVAKNRGILSDRIPPPESNEDGFLVLVNLSDDYVTVDSTTFNSVPTSGTVKIRSVDFKQQNAVIG